MRPIKFEDFTGQDSVKTVCKILIESAKLQCQSVPHILISSPPGHGKTTLANIIANEMGSKLFIINCGLVNSYKQIINIIDEMNINDILFLDECHSLSKKVSEFMYTIMEDFVYFDEHGGEIGIPEITVLGASTQIGQLLQPFKDRFRYTAELVQYTEEELTNICKKCCEKKGFTLSDDIAALITKTCRLTPRIMVNRIEWIYSYMRIMKLNSLSKENLLEIIKLQGVNQDGLESQDIRYLKSLSSIKQGVSQISSKISIDESTIKGIIEPYLIKMGLVNISRGGRCLTRNGQQYIKNFEKSC